MVGVDELNHHTSNPRAAIPINGSIHRVKAEPAALTSRSAVRAADLAAASPGTSLSEKPEGKALAMLAFWSVP